MKTFREAEEEYKKDPFKPFWEKEDLLRDMMSSTAKKIAEDDIFLPEFSKKRIGNRLK